MDKLENLRKGIESFFPNFVNESCKICYFIASQDSQKVEYFLCLIITSIFLGYTLKIN